MLSAYAVVEPCKLLLMQWSRPTGVHNYTSRILNFDCVELIDGPLNRKYERVCNRVQRKNAMGKYTKKAEH